MSPRKCELLLMTDKFKGKFKSIESISDDRPIYGDQRRPWSKEFVEYMYEIVAHPSYQGMPGATDHEGKIDWTIPSNRKPGSKNWNGNSLRREWWKSKALSLGIPIEGKWLSTTAKRIHPFGKKPCQTCGQIAEIAYVYPGAILKKKLVELLEIKDLFVPGKLQNIDSIIRLIIEKLNQEKIEDFIKNEFPLIVPHISVWPTEEANIAALVREKYCSIESNKFSPGAMANPPDRLDGFHTYNLCCRSKEDTGRSVENLRSYTVDRRAFEYWSSGDWVAADLAMGSTGEGTCKNCGSRGNISADHIGPISLGFAHSPYFKPLCPACNSAKGNRMSYLDVKELLRLELTGEIVASPQLVFLWDEIKNGIKGDKQALLASKLFRINQDHYFKLLYKCVTNKIPDQIMNFLPIGYADYRVEFTNFDKETLIFDGITRTKRQDSYSRIKATRMVRVAFESLRKYNETDTRNIQTVEDRLIKDSLYEFRMSVDLAKNKPSTPIRKELNLAIQYELSQLEDALFAKVVDLYEIRDSSEVEVATLKVMKELSKTLIERFERGENTNWGD